MASRVPGVALRTYRGLRQQSAKGKAIAAMLDEARPRVHRRDGYRCMVRLSPDCSGRAEDLHHTKLRSGGWSLDECHADDALLSACRACHMHLHGHPAEAEERGFIVRRYA